VVRFFLENRLNPGRLALKQFPLGMANLGKGRTPVYFLPDHLESVPLRGELIVIQINQDKVRMLIRIERWNRDAEICNPQSPIP